MACVSSCLSKDSTLAEALASSSLGIPSRKLQSQLLQVSLLLVHACTKTTVLQFSTISFRPNAIVVRNSHRCDWIYVVMSVSPKSCYNKIKIIALSKSFGNPLQAHSHLSICYS